MKKVKDNFSAQANGYSKFRPVYPQALYDEILNLVYKKATCWDCATGNGQMAVKMASSFEKVYATDISKEQLANATHISNVWYSICRAEKTNFEDDKFDLITVGQAVHWFDHESFNREVKRVAKNNAVVAIVGYGLMYADQPFDRKLMEFYDGTIGEYWDSERKHIDNHYSSIPFPFEPIESSNKFSIDVNWSLRQLQGYLGTWSSVNRFIKQHAEDPVTPFINDLVNTGIWQIDEKKDVHFPLLVKLGRVLK